MSDKNQNAGMYNWKEESKKDAVLSNQIKAMYLKEEQTFTIDDNMSVGKWLNILNKHLPMLNSVMKMASESEHGMKATIDLANIPVKNLYEYRKAMIRECVVEPPFDKDKIDDIPRDLFFALAGLIGNNYSIVSFLGL